jgi:hypothetical protein
MFPHMKCFCYSVTRPFKKYCFRNGQNYTLLLLAVGSLLGSVSLTAAPYGRLSAERNGVASKSNSGISGVTTICERAKTILGADGTGSWLSSNSAVASIDVTGAVTGISAGIAVISYLNATDTSVITATITVMPLPNAGQISGPDEAKLGSAITLTNASANGNWSVGNNSAFISPAGILTASAVGSAVVSYTVVNRCGIAIASKALAINYIIPTPIEGIYSVCEGSSTALSNVTYGGSWSSSNTAIATVSAEGVVNGMSEGTAAISYSMLGSVVTSDVVVTRKLITAPTTLAVRQPSTIRIFPNPTAGSVTVTCDLAGVLIIFNPDGKEAGRFDIPEGTTSHTLPKNIAPGVYACRFNGNDGSNLFARLIYEP